MLTFIYRFLKGFIHVKLNTENPEKFLNLCSANGIEIWKSTYKNKTLYFKTNIKSFKLIKKINSRFVGKVHITGKVGIPFITNRYKTRYGLFVGLIIYIGFLFFMSGLVWNIETLGVGENNKAAVIKSAKEIGIDYGVKVSSIDTKVMRNELLLKAKELSWAAINIEGCSVTIDATETEKKDEITYEPSNLKAMYDGVITAVEVKKGTAAVSVGQPVRKGDVLISGTVEYKDMHTELVRAKGTVIAEIESTLTVSQPLKIKENVRTGKEKKLYAVNFFGIKFPLYLGGIKGKYEYEKEEKSVKLWKKHLPITITEKIFYETREKETYFSHSDAKKLCEEKLNEKIKEFVAEGEILSKKITEKADGDSLDLTVEIKCKKNITFEEKMLISTGNER